MNVRKRTLFGNHILRCICALSCDHCPHRPSTDWKWLTITSMLLITANLWFVQDCGQRSWCKWSGFCIWIIWSKTEDSTKYAQSQVSKSRNWGVFVRENEFFLVANYQESLQSTHFVTTRWCQSSPRLFYFQINRQKLCVRERLNDTKLQFPLNDSLLIHNPLAHRPIFGGTNHGT